MPRLVVPILSRALAQLALLIERAVIRQDEVRAVADQQVLGRSLTPTLRSPSISADERDRVDDHAVADDAHLSRAQDAGRDEMQDVFLAADE